MNYVVGPVLGALSVIDVKKRKIPVWPVFLMGMVLLVMRLWSGTTAGELACGLIPGAVLLLVSWVTKEKLGVGDGLLIFCLGMGYEIEAMMTMTGTAFATAAVVSMILMVVRRATRKTELPFLPFLLVGWLISVFV